MVSLEWAFRAVPRINGEFFSKITGLFQGFKGQSPKALKMAEEGESGFPRPKLPSM